jgi:uncharacterized protein with PQ loop repeat
MTPDEYEDILYDHSILRWSARILGTLEAGFLVYLAYDQLVKVLINQGTSALISLIGGYCFLVIILTIAFLGLIIAYWKEGLGGGTSLACFIVLFIGSSDFHMSFIIGMAIAALPGILYFTYWLKVYLDIKKAERDQPTDC